MSKIFPNIQISTLKSLSICSRCLNHEINSWVNENWLVLDEETKRQIHEELKAVKIKEGNCLVCKDVIISDGASERILNVLEQNNISEKTKEEFKKFFFV